MEKVTRTQHCLDFCSDVYTSCRGKDAYISVSDLCKKHHTGADNMVALCDLQYVKKVGRGVYHWVGSVPTEQVATIVMKTAHNLRQKRMLQAAQIEQGEQIDTHVSLLKTPEHRGIVRRIVRWIW